MKKGLPKRTPRKYSRALDWKVVRGTVEGAGAMMLLSQPGFSDILEDYLEISRRRRENRAAIFKLQMHLLQDLEEQERSNKYFKEKLAESQATNDKDTIEQSGARLSAIRLYGNALRVIGDGIVWRALNYDRAVLQVLSRAATKQTVIADGTSTEIRVWAEQFETSSGSIPLLNALSNWLAIGDVTVVNSDGSIDLFEVKAGNSRSPRITRQKDRLTASVTLLTKGEGTLEGVPVEFHRADIFPENGLAQLNNLLEAAGLNGWAASRLSNCAYVECVDFNKLVDRDWLDKKKKLREQELRDWTERGDFVHSKDSADLLTFTPNCAPLSIFPFKARTCVDLLIGTKSYRVYLNVDAVCREFGFRNWKVVKTATDLHAEGRLDNTCAIIERKGLQIELPAPFLMRTQMETIRPQVFVKLCDLIFGAGPGTRTDFEHSYVFNDEKEIWD